MTRASTSAPNNWSLNMNANRMVSGLLAIVYVAAAVLHGDAELAFMMVLFTILPLACIWCGEAMGGYLGPATVPITKRSPGQVVCVLGEGSAQYASPRARMCANIRSG